MFFVIAGGITVLAIVLNLVTQVRLMCCLKRRGPAARGPILRGRR
jgi:hypothetical protein